MKKYFLLFLLFLFIASLNSQTKFAVIGDYGNAGPDELAVANLVKCWNPEVIITLGDNNYDVGSQATIDQNIGQYFHEFIYPYTGSFGPGDTVNRFFPSLGNHDWETPGALPYLNYFSLPGNERYYDFIKGPVHFFVIDSDANEPDGRDSNSVQAQWLKNKLAISSSKFNIVYFHHPPYCSGLIQGSEIIMRWPFKSWGASAVMSGHEHLYERLTINGLTYFVNGLGGNLRSVFGFPVSGSQVRYSANYGAMLVNAYEDSLVLKFYNTANSLRDNYKILPSQKILSLTAEIEGLYDPVSNLMITDTAEVYLRKSYPPFSIADSVKGILSSSGTGTFSFIKADNATDYYLIIRQRNSLETWSANKQSFVFNNLSYDFTTASSKAFGNNLVLKGTKYCLYSGDVNRDGFIDLFDIVMIYNDASDFLSGYVVSDLNGDNISDLADQLISYNNSISFISLIRP